MSELFGTFCGIVENVKDPEKLGRVKVRVPHVYGFIGQNDLPWALPAGMPAGNSASSGGFTHLPEPGDQVFVRFLDGEPEKPIWEWGPQTVDGAAQLKLHQYQAAGKTVGPPIRAGWTRYGHTVELNSDGVIVTSSQGYSLALTNGGDDEPSGTVDFSTPKGAKLEIDDSSGDWTAYAIENVNLNIGDTVALQSRALDFDVTDSVRVVAGTAVDLEAGTDINIKFQALYLNSGKEPFVLGNQLVQFLNSLLIWLTTHTHGNGNLGSPTTPPLIPPVGTVSPEPSTVVSKTVFGI